METSDLTTACPVCGRRLDSPRLSLGAGLRALAGAPNIRRSRRVAILVLSLLMLNLFDLTFTALAHRVGGLYELNPMAELFLPHTGALAMFKLFLAVPALLILLALRRRLSAEIACWVMAAVYVSLALRWAEYFRLLS